MGKNVVVFWTNDSIVTASGTSFSCPIIAGMTACLWQARPNATPARIYKTIEESSSHYSCS
jgi:subtilisin family serine protease